MPTSSSRRNWLKNTAVVLSGLSLSPGLAIAEERPFRTPGSPVLLNSNENPYGPSSAVRKAMAEAMVKSNRYPDDQVQDLLKEIADFWEVSADNILLGAGSSELLGLSFLLASSNKKEVITGEPCYSVWHGQAEAFGLRIRKVSLTEQRVLNLEGMLAAASANTGLVYVCNPNNPTGTFVPDKSLRIFVEECSKERLVLVDEAYTEYQELSSLKDMAISNPNVIVAKTFSKIYGLAGARIGYVIAHGDTIKKISAMQPWPDVSITATTAAAASAALKDQAFVKLCRAKNAVAKEMCYETFRKLQLEYLPSVTNFILFNIDKIAADFQHKMEANNISVQYRNHFGGKWCRVTMGTTEEMKRFCSTLKSIAG